MRTRTKICLTCGKNFSYEIGQGKDRIHCSDDCRVKHKLKLREIRIRNAPKCKTNGCNNVVVNRVGFGLCESCYYRLRRTGTTIKQIRKPTYRYITGAGYIKLLKPDHPLADSKGYVFEHRIVAYDKYGEGTHECHWCGSLIEWNELVVDHLDEDKQNNSIDNLVISCNNCNRARGAVKPFIERLKPDKVDELFFYLRKYKTAREDGGFGNG